MLYEKRASNFLDHLLSRKSYLKSLYEDQDRRKEIDSIGGGVEMEDFYNRLKNIKDFYRRNPYQALEADEVRVLGSRQKQEETEIDHLFSGEEGYGRYFDFHDAYDKWINLKFSKKFDYLTFLSEFDNFESIARNDKISGEYLRYLETVVSYIEDFISRARPLFNLDGLKSSLYEAFEIGWSKNEIKGWETICAENNSSDFYCDACRKTFAKETVFKAHLTGKKHIKAEELMAKGEYAKDKSNGGDYFQKCKNIAFNEFKITKFMQIFGQLREDTKSNVERKQSRTVEEREEDVTLEQEGDFEEDEEAEEDGKIYNPLKLPLDWDGKPIPYWLWKLHGLGVEYPCEICGHYIYMGRRAFDRHFQEWRHSHGMKCLGIPNMKQFYGITSISDAFALWDKLKTNFRTEAFRPEVMEEIEDDKGNVFNRKTFEDLKRQGLI